MTFPALVNNTLDSLPVRGYNVAKAYQDKGAGDGYRITRSHYAPLEQRFKSAGIMCDTGY
jgi:hypothetical protein